MEEAQKYKALGNSAFQEGNFYEAIEHFTKAIELNPNDHIFFSNRSGAYASLKQYSKALEDADKCVEMKPDWAKGYQRKGLAEFYLEKHDEAIASYEKGLTIDPNNALLKEGLERAKGEKSHQGGMDQQTQQMLMKLMSNPKTKEYMQDPQFVQKLQMMQQNPQMMGMFANDPKIMTALQVMLGLPEGFNFDMGGMGGAQKGQQEEGQEEENEEKEKEQKTEQQKPQQPAYKKESPKKEEKKLEPSEEAKIEGNNYYKNKEFQKAIEMYDKAISLKPSEVIYYSNKVAVYIEMKEYEKAHETIDKAIEVMDEIKLNDWVKRAKIFQRKASIYANQKEYTKSIEFYEKALLEDNNSRIKEEMKAVQKQKQKFEEEQYIDPEKAEEHNNKGREFFMNGKFPEALKEYEESIKRNPSDPKYYTNKASCLIKLMEFPSALKVIEKALQLQPENAKAYAKKGQIHYGMKEYYRSQESYEKGLKIDPENAECKDGLLRVRDKMYSQPESKEEAEERARHAMADPEIQSILRDPQIMMLLQNMQENPHSADNQKALRDPKVGEKINKLVAAGIIKTH